MKKIKLAENKFFVPAIISIVVLIITAQSFLLKSKTFIPGEPAYTHYNNYVIFKQSFFHLIENKDLYELYPAEHFDYFKYSPTFSLFMAPLAVLPDAIGLFFWNLLNVLVLYFALRRLPLSSNKIHLLMLGFVFIELLTSTQNSQSNALIAGLIILAFTSLEKKNIALASLFIILTVFIKIFGLVALAIFMFYPNKLRAALYTIGWTLLLAALPLLVVSVTQLSFLYQSWLHLLQNDHSASVGFSVAGWLYTWFHIDAKNATVLIGAFIFCLPFLKWKYYNEVQFKLFFLSSILLWIVIFNHKAESATFIIAVTGIAIWFFSQKITLLNATLLGAAFIFTILSPTDLFPKSIRDNFVIPYVLKAVPCILIWFKIMYDLLFFKPTGNLFPGSKAV